MLDPVKDGKPALEALISRSLGQPVSLGEVAQLSGGASSATYRLEATVGGEPRQYIFQRAGGEGGRGPSRAVQAEVQRRAAPLGVPVAEVIAIADPADGLGDAVVTGLVAGEALAPRWLRQEDYALARTRMTQQCAQALAKLHGAPLSTWEGLSLNGGSGAELLADMFDWYRRLGVDVPAFDLAFAFLKPRMPTSPASCLSHGDFRSGNFLVDQQGLAAVLDWELTHLSVPGEDLGWLCAQAWRFGNWQKPVGGFGDRDELIAAYRAAGGAVSADELHVWEVYGNLKWGMSCLQLADDHLSGRVPSVERATIGRRVTEVAADLIYLIGFGEL